MLENMRISIQGIWSHKMRSFLTMLGIIIGIASIIAIVSTIKGTSEQIKEDLIGAGNNTVSVSLNYGDSDYDPEYGMTDGTEPPLLSDQQKEDVMNLDHVENATFFCNRSVQLAVYYLFFYFFLEFLNIQFTFSDVQFQAVNLSLLNLDRLIT